MPGKGLVAARITVVKARYDISMNALEAHYLSGGNVVNVVNATISDEKPIFSYRLSELR